MIDTTQTSIQTLSVHGVGNRSNQGTLRLSGEPLRVDGSLLSSLLLTYFISPFRTPEYYTFETDEHEQPTNSVFFAAKEIIDDPETLHANSIALAERLYEITQHPNIKAGELYVGLFTNLVIRDTPYSAVGIFKSESKENYLKVEETSTGYDLGTDLGINVHKLDKGCLILHDSVSGQFKVLLLDNANRADAHFWKDDFLGVKPLADEFRHTHNFMNLTRSYVGDQLDEEFSVSKADKIDLLNRSMNFFKSHDEFNKAEFESEVLADPSVIESFRNYERTFTTDEDIADNFEISAQAVKLQARVFKSVLKLDKNFHIYIHGNRELIEKGFDEVMRRSYYKLYFDQES